MNEAFCKIRARWIAPVTSPMIDDGVIVASKDRIVEVRKFESGVDSDAMDLGDVLILPGLINCHTHLEFSDLEEPLGEAGNSITDWIPKVIADRINKSAKPNGHRAAIQKGLSACWDSGTVFVGEIATRVDCLDLYDESSLEGILFYERLGNSVEGVDDRVREAQEFLTAMNSNRDESNWQRGISPHASYSVSNDLLNRLIELGCNHQTIAATHLAETREELQWLTERKGPFNSLLTQLNAQPAIDSKALQIGDLIDKLSQLERCLLIHGNYLTDEELDRIEATQGRIGIVFCPQTHAFFGHDSYPLEAILSRNIPFGIGTDSLASNPNLNMLEEARQLAQTFPQMSPAKILEVVTIQGARLMRVEDRFGEIAAGHSFKLAGIQGIESDHPIRQVLDDRTLKARPLKEIMDEAGN